MSAQCPITTALLVALLFPGCSTGPELVIKIDESPQGAVYLRPISDRSFQYAHPITIDPSTIALALSGIVIRDNQGSLQNGIGTAEARRAFSGSEVGYLAPLITEGLRRAAPDQQVEFTVRQVGHPGLSEGAGAGVGSEPPMSVQPRESTNGVLYAYGRSLYVTLTRYRSREEPATIINMANHKVSDATGLANRTVWFLPEAAKRPKNYLDARSTGHTLVIDWELLAMLPEASSVPASAQSAPVPPPSQAASGEKADPPKKDAEIEALRRELQEIKKQLAEQQADRARSQHQPPVPPR
jgi:hypothetical protein